MPKAKLRVSIPEEVWIHRISMEYPEISFQVIAVLSGEESGIALLKFQAEDPDSIISSIEEQDDVTDFDLLWKQNETRMIQVEMSNPLLLFPILKAGIPLQTPFEVIEGTAIWEVTTSSERLSALGSRLNSANISFEIQYVRNEPSEPTDDLLTDRQRELLLRAAEEGYYDTPRRTTLTELCELLNISKATGSDILHRSEGKLVKWFIDEYLMSS